MCCRTRCRKLSLLFALLALAVLAAPAFAQDNVPYFCNGTSSAGGNCTLFQLDGSQNATANGDTCVGATPLGPGGGASPEFGCSANQQDPVWPADWDALLYPSLIGTSSPLPIISGTAPGAYTFSTPWGSFGSFSGIIPSSLVTTGTSTILKQGTKNTDDLSKWVVASQASPPKDAYLAGAIVSYVAPSTPTPPVDTFYAGHELLYLGSTRVSPNGSATVGIWFFQENVVVCASGTSMCSGSPTGPAANHRK